MKNAKVSIIVPIYNVEQYIEECINSILAQTYSNLEIIIVDDCSTDNTLAICEEIIKTDERVKLFHNEKNSGVSFSRNRALDAVTGEYIAMIDSDDWVDKNYIELMVSAIEETNADACICGYSRYYGNNISEEYYQVTHETQVKTNKEILDCAMQPNVPFVGFICSKMYRYSIINENKLRFDTDISICEDSLFNYSYFDSAENCVLIKDCLYHYRIRQQSATRTANAEKIKTKLLAFQKANSIAKKHPQSIFYYRVNATIYCTALQYIYAFFKNGGTIPYEEYKQMISIAKAAFRQTKLKYIPRKEILRFILFVLFPKLFKVGKKEKC